MSIESDLKANFNEIMDAVSDDLLISDGQGKVLRVSPSFEEVYGIAKEYAIGKTVYRLEKEGYFKPSIIAKVLNRKERITMLQKSNRGRDIIVTATPVMDDEGQIKFVVSFSRDITEMITLQKKYSKLENQVEKYTKEISELRRKTKPDETVIWQSLAMEKVLNTVNRVADLDANVLLLGESGTGKTMLAKIMHQKSGRAKGAFVDINCAAIPENLLESELFGYEKGSFTGADTKGKAGLIELADKGTLLLDEISELPITLQAKLLKAIQEKVITRIGGTRPIKVDFRLIAATNRDLEADADEGKFRKDLYFRLNVVSIKIPSLSERREDIIPLIKYYTDKCNEKYKMNKMFLPKVIDAFVGYNWPGNVRELANVVERALITSEAELVTIEDIPKEIFEFPMRGDIEEIGFEGSLNDALEALEKKLIRQAYARYGTTTGVAKCLKISQPTAYRKISKYVNP